MTTETTTRPDPMVHAPMLMAHYHEMHQQVDRFMELWREMPDVPEVLRYERTVTRETCTQLITAFRTLHTHAQEAANYVEHYPSESSYTTRRSLRMLVEQLDALLLHLVVFREQCREVSVSALRQRHDLMARFLQVRDTLLSEALESLDDDAEECNVGEDWHLEKGPAPTTTTAPEEEPQPEAQQQETPTSYEEETDVARV